ncbi:MAG: methionyl-tRNA formyltransferase [Burkholderiales bacterium]|nr:methionyl-tRNA formyltransferase [Burkholderiales bacterium]
MRAIFAGTPEFAAAALAALLKAGIEVPLVLTRADQPAGRGMIMTASPVKRLALDYAIEVLQPDSLKRDAAVLARVVATPHDVMVVAAYGLILPPQVLAIPPRGCLNIHASLLPRWRGAAPIQRAIEAGDAETGICIMQMDAGLDTGAVLLERRTAISASDTAATLEERLTALGAATIVTALAELDHLTPRAQPASGATYAHKIAKHEAPLDFALDAATLARKVRAFDPFPGATMTMAGSMIKVWAAHSLADSPAAPPGTVTAFDASGIAIACGKGSLVVTRLQRPGGRRISAREFADSVALAPGQRMG